MCFPPENISPSSKKWYKNDGIHIFDRRLYLPALPKPHEILAVKLSVDLDSTSAFLVETQLF